MTPIRFLILILWLFTLSACATPSRAETLAESPIETPTSTPFVCPVTEPEWLVHPEDSAVLNEPAPGYYVVNKDQSIWASAWWHDAPEFPLRAGDDGNKLGWFRPAGASLEITGQRLDAEAPLMKAEIPCCYPTRFQATGLYFPTEGCWEVIAKAEESELTFVVQVEP